VLTKIAALTCRGISDGILRVHEGVLAQGQILGARQRSPFCIRNWASI